jgi:epoxyqueuosine reductase
MAGPEQSPFTLRERQRFSEFHTLDPPTSTCLPIPGRLKHGGKGAKHLARKAFLRHNPVVGTRADTDWINERALGIGFDLCGVVRVEAFPELQRYEEWLGRDYAGEMKYLEDPRRRDPTLVKGDPRSVIVCGLIYNTALPYSVEAAARPAIGEPRGWISRYAWGSDYHEVLREKLGTLEEALRVRFPAPFHSRTYADVGPVAERVWAKHAGLGWLGKNTLLLNETLGSWFFLGVILTSLELIPTLGPAESPPADLCGNCRQCLDACPTGALVEPYVMDARRCISYLTIELRGSIPQEHREAIGWQVFGCDICQDVCPFNRDAPRTQNPEFDPRGASSRSPLLQPSLVWLAGLEEQEFRARFRGTAIKRTKWRGMVRNACIALGNVGLSRGNAAHLSALTLLERLAKSEERVIAESAQWALSRIL